MNVVGAGRNRVALLQGLIGVAALSAVALALPPATSPERIHSADHTYFLPPSAEISDTLLPDGRMFEVYGADGVAYLIDGNARHQLMLPERRRFASVTVMPGGQVLVWGGIDEHGQVLATGEWFDPAHAHFVHTGVLGLPARAGHTLTVLSSGDVLMTGGWSQDGTPATTAVVWQPKSHEVVVLDHVERDVRLDAVATLQPDGSVRIDGGVSANGLTVPTALRFDPRAQTLRLISPPASIAAVAPVAPIITALPGIDTTAAPLQGPLTLRFNTVMDVRALTTKTVTLLGPEGAVPIHVVGTNEGRQAFVQLPDDLYPGSRYTLFVNGLHTADGAPVPYTAVGFTTAQSNETGVVVAGQGGQPAPSSLPTAAVDTTPPLYVMAGAGAETCVNRTADQLCRTHGFIRDGAWYPGQDNAANFTGAHWRLYRPHQSLPNTQVLEANLPKGTAALIGQVRQIDEKPVANVEVSIGALKTRTNADGVFVMTGVPAGRQEVFVDGDTASHGDVQYGRFLVGADIKARMVSHMPFVMYLPRVLPRDEVRLPSPTSRETVLTHPDMPGLELHIPAGAVFKDRDGHVLAHIAIVPTPVDHAPFPLPNNFPMYFTIQPGDAVVEGLTPEAAKGIRVVYPNYGHSRPNTVGNFWVYSAKEGWQMYGGGHVTVDAKQVVPDPGVSLVWAMGAGMSMGNADPGNNSTLCNATRSQPIDLQTGIFFHEWSDFSIHDVTPLVLTRAYNSADSNSHVFGIGGNSNIGMHLYTSVNSVSNNNAVVTPELIMPCGEAVAFHLTIGTTTWPFTNSVWEHTGTDSVFYGATLQFFCTSACDTNTPIGEYWMLTMKDGTEYGFQNEVPNQLQWIKDRYGNQITLNYNGGLVDQMVSPSGRSITLNYDSGNRITSAADNSGRTMGYAYNSAGDLATVTYPDQTTEQYTYDGSNRMLTMQDRRGHVWVTNQYDTNSRVTKQTLADNTTYQFTYTTNSNNVVTATTVTDPNGNQEYLTFDPVSTYPLTDTYAYGTSSAQTSTYVRQASGLISSETDALGRTIAYTYDGLGNVLSVTRLSGTPSATATQFTYNALYNQLASVTDPLGHTTSFSYTNGCLTQITDALSHNTTIQCNGAGQPTTVQDALGHTTTLAYQGYDLQSTTDALNRTTNYVVDTLGRRIATRDPLGNVSLTQYDTNDRVIAATDPLNQATAMTYDGNGNLLTVTLPNQGVITSTYDNRNRRITRTDAMNQSESWTYDGMSNVLTHTDRKGQVTDVSYDALNRRSLVSYADGSGIQAAYDAGNRLTGLTDSVSGSLGWGYDGLDRVTATTSPQGSVSYTYDAAGRRTGMTPAAQAAATYTYDNANRLTAIVQGSETVQLGYDATNRRALLTLPNGVTVNYGYDNANELTALTYAQGNGTSLGNLAYGYDGDGRVNSKGGSLATDVAPTPTTQAPTFDFNDRETHFNGVALSYDANGNLTNDGTNTYTWNARNQLTQIAQGSTVEMSYAYDAMGRRTSKAVQGGTPTQFLYDGANAVQETVGTTINPILVGLNVDERFARNDTTGRTYFLSDAINSTLALTNSSGAIQNTYSYDPYGNTTQSNTAFTNPYQYTGREADSPGLYYYRARYYSPMMAGFISEDPAQFFGGQLTFYGYAGGDPLDFNDPSGRFLPEAAIGGLIGGAFGAMSGYLSGDRGSQLLEDTVSGAATGALIGLTDGLSLAPNLVADAGLKAALDFGIGSGMETVRQLSNYGCVKSWGDVAIAGALGATSAGSGTGVYRALGTELSDAASYGNAAITSAATGSLQNVIAGDEAEDERESHKSEGCGCN